MRYTGPKQNEFYQSKEYAGATRHLLVIGARYRDTAVAVLESPGQDAERKKNHAKEKRPCRLLAVFICSWSQHEWVTSGKNATW
ncbi:hypothetical protein Y1Q_0003073 [Alligator mississippiensis]|uniref:Uncharacterized protein n=1 Tax=Alligator mississippiensis TaxID=8496 RepID=A0A151MDD2_ALLMI|nr:hypothetical protein Y1Q_0003073 [Alligator mississippiensis]